MAITYGKAIQAINSDAQFTFVNNDINTIEWLNGTSPINISDIEAKKAELEAVEANIPNIKASAKAKLIAGEALTQEEADTIVL
nr:hypothetical protein [uncultured Mediterranean phage uvMED]